MNKIKTYTGGQPFPKEDFDFLQDGIKDAFYGLLSAIGIAPSESFVISGCQITETAVGNDTTISVTAGYISLNGEILKVDAHSINRPQGQTAYWDVEVTYADPSPLVFFDNNSHETLEVRRGKLKSSSTPPADYMPYDAYKLMQWQDKTLTNSDLKTTIGGGNLFYLQNAASIDKVIRFRRTGKNVEIYFRIIGNVSTSPVGGLVIKLPNGMIAKNIRSSVGHFVNTAGGAEGNDPVSAGVKQTATRIQVTNENIPAYYFTTPGDAIVVTPIRSSYSNFDVSGTDNVFIEGYIVFEIV